MVKLKVALECYSITPIIEKTRQFKWLEQHQTHKTGSTQSNAYRGHDLITGINGINGITGIDRVPRLEIRNSIEYIMINIKKLKLPTEQECSLKHYELQYPFTYDDFIRFARDIASELSRVSTASSWIQKLQYMKDYILAPLQITSREVVIGIIILNSSLEAPTFLDVLESNIYLSSINLGTKQTQHAQHTQQTEFKCDLIAGILAVGNNKLSKKMKLYIMNCRGYIPYIQIYRRPKDITATNFFQNRLNP